VLFLLAVPSAGAWTWPVAGPVLQPFSFDPAHPYAGGQHRGIDIGADSGATIVAPVAGTVTFAGTVPSSGSSLTILTADSLSVTLTHLGSLAVAKGAAVAEGAPVGTVGPSGTPEVTAPYVHLGVRTVADDNGYLDPLGFLPSLTPAVPPAPAPAPAPDPAPPADPVTTPELTPPPAGVDTAPAVTTPLETTPLVTAPAPAPASAPPVETPIPAVEPATPPTAAPAFDPAVPPTVVDSSDATPPQATVLVEAANGAAAPASADPIAIRAGLPALLVARPVAVPRLAHAPAAATRPPVQFTSTASIRRALPSAPAAPRHGHETPFPLVLAAAGAAALAVLLTLARMLLLPSATREGVSTVREDPRCSGVAVCERPAAHRPRGGLRRAGGRVRALPPAERRRRPHGERHRRARDAGDGVRGPRGRVAA
jgi:hypothetical protein